MVAPGMPASETDRTVPSVPASRKTGCWLILLAAVAPIATTAPPGATVAPDTDARAALPSVPVGSQDAPVPVLVKAVICPAAVVPVTTKPALLPFTTLGVHPPVAGSGSMVAAY